MPETPPLVLSPFGVAPSSSPGERGSYDETNISGPTRDRMRSRLGDTGVLKDPESDGRLWLLSDAELDAMTLAYKPEPPATPVPGWWSLTVADAAESLAIRFAQSPEVYTDEGGARVEWRGRVQAWTALASRLRAEVDAKTQGIGPTFAVGQMAGPDLSRIGY